MTGDPLHPWSTDRPRREAVQAFLRDLHDATGLGIEIWTRAGDPLEIVAAPTFCDLVHAQELDQPAACREHLAPRPDDGTLAATVRFRRCALGLWRALRVLPLGGGAEVVVRIGPYQLPRGRGTRRQIRSLVSGSSQPARLESAARQVPVRSHAQVAATFTLVARTASLVPGPAAGAPGPEPGTAPRLPAFPSDRHHLELLVNGIPDPLFVKDRQHAWLLVNDAFCRFMGYPRERILGKSDYDFFPAAEADVFWEKDEAVFVSGGENLNEEHFTDATGFTHTIVTRKSLIPTADGAPCLVGIIRDVSAVKETEAALIRSQQLAAVGTLAAGVAHEFNNINTSVMGSLQRLRAWPDLPAEARDQVERSLRVMGRAATLTGKLLGFAAPSSAQREPTDLPALVRDTAAIVEPALRAEGIELVLNLEPVPRLLLHPAQLGQVVMNLLINARHAVTGRPVRRIVLSTAARTDQACLTVSDTGCGIAPEQLPRLFLPFYSGKGEHARGDPVQAGLKGTGLGLSISDTIVREHGGSIAVASEPGSGATFTVLLPLGPADVRPRAARLRRSTSGTLRIAPRVLVVDDETDVRDLIATVLEDEGMIVTTVASGEQALDLVPSGGFDVMLVDLLLGGLHGFELLRRLPPGGPEVIVVTGQLSPDVVGEARRLGAAAFVRKPFEVPDLVRTVQRSVARRQGR